MKPVIQAVSIATIILLGGCAVPQVQQMSSMLNETQAMSQDIMAVYQNPDYRDSQGRLKAPGTVTNIKHFNATSGNYGATMVGSVAFGQAGGLVGQAVDQGVREQPENAMLRVFMTMANGENIFVVQPKEERFAQDFEVGDKVFYVSEDVFDMDDASNNTFYVVHQ